MTPFQLHNEAANLMAGLEMAVTCLMRLGQDRPAEAIEIVERKIALAICSLWHLAKSLDPETKSAVFHMLQRAKQYRREHPRTEGTWFQSIEEADVEHEKGMAQSRDQAIQILESL